MEATKHVILNWKNPNSDRKSWTLLVTYYESDTVTLTLYLLVFSMFDRFFELFDKYGGYKTGHLKLKKPKQLQEILDIARDLLSESDFDHNPEVQEKKAKLRQLKLVLEMWVISLYSSFIVCDLFRNVAKVVRLVGRGVRSHMCCLGLRSLSTIFRLYHSHYGVWLQHRVPCLWYWSVMHQTLYMILHPATVSWHGMDQSQSSLGPVRLSA